MKISTTLLSILLIAVVAIAEEDNKTSLSGRPQPRQIFRGGLDDNRKKYQNGRRSSLQSRRNRNRDPETGQFSISPTPKIQNLQFRPNAAENEDQKSNYEDQQTFKNENSQPQNVVENVDDEDENVIVTERNVEEASDFVNDFPSKEKKEISANFLESADYQETRSPAHRYSDEKYSPAEYKRSTPSLPAYQITSASEERVKVTRRPIERSDYNPFSQFNPIASKPQEEDTPVKQNSQERYQHSPSVRRFQEQRFSSQAAEERKFETRPNTQKQSSPNFYQQRDAPVRKTFSSRPSQRFINRIQNNNQLQHQNQIPENSYPEENFRANSNRPKIESNREEENYYQDSEYYDGGDYEDDEPDRLSELLIVSKFTCSNRKDGYYADEHVDCEVFHFCQDGVKHSWLCPNDAAFHQVHLICMPRSEDNICAKSSKFHFVNDFLYKEVGNHPQNRSYVERYYPRGYQGGVANIPEYDDGEVPPQAQPTRPYRERQYIENPKPPQAYSNRRQFERHPARNERVPVNEQIRNEKPREVDQSLGHSYKQQRPKFNEKRQQLQQFESDEINVPQSYFQQHRPAPVQKVQERPFKRPTFQQEPRQKLPSFEPEQEEQQFNAPKFQPSRRHPGPSIFEERPSANLALDQPMPSKLPSFQEAQAIEHRPRNPPQRPPSDLHISPVFRSQERPTRAPFYSNPNRNLQALHSIRHIQRQKAPEHYGMTASNDSPSFSYDS